MNVMWQDGISFVELKANASAPPGHRSVARSLVSVNELIFRKHLKHSRFRAGLDQGDWRLVEITWPFSIIGLRKRVRGTTQEAALRFRLDRYPLKPPGLDLWNIRSRKIVEAPQWPNWFDISVAALHPRLNVVGLVAYTPKLLEISATIARKLKDQDLESWDPSGDLTQCLIPILHNYRFSSQRRQKNGKTHAVGHERMD